MFHQDEINPKQCVVNNDREDGTLVQFRGQHEPDRSAADASPTSSNVSAAHVCAA
jgi:hypothetical protein